MSVGNTTQCGRPELDTIHGRNQLPMDMERFLISHLTSPGDTVLDLMGGTGTTSIAAIAEHRHSIFVDNDLPGTATAKARVETFFRNEAAKQAYLKVQSGEVVTDTATMEAAKGYSRGAVVDMTKPTLAEVEDYIVKHVEPYSGLVRLAEKTWEMDVGEARAMLVSWIMCKDKAGFEGFVWESTKVHPKDAVAYLARFDAALMKEKIAEVAAASASEETTTMPGPSAAPVRA